MSFSKGKIFKPLNSLTPARKIEIKKKRDGEEEFRVVRSKKTFETPNTELLSKVRQQFPEEEKPVEPEAVVAEEPAAEEQVDPFKAKGGFKLNVSSSNIAYC
jgi:hypothetical protein